MAKFSCSKPWNIWKKVAYVTFVLVLVKDNWDRVTRKYGDTQAGGFIRYVVTLVNLRPHVIFKLLVLVILLPPILYVSNDRSSSSISGHQFTSNEKAAEFSRFFATRKKPEFERTLKQSLENVRISARWIQGIKSEPRLAQTVQELLRRPWSRLSCRCGRK